MESLKQRKISENRNYTITTQLMRKLKKIPNYLWKAKREKGNERKRPEKY